MKPFNGNGTKCTTVHNPESADPSSPEDGGMWYRDNVGHKVRREGVTRTLYDTAGGMAYAAAKNLTGGTVTSVQTTILSAAFAGANVPAAGGSVIIHVSVEVGRNSGAPNANIEISDGVVIVSADVQLYHTAGASAFERTISFDFPYTIPAGARTFELSLWSDTPGNNINWRNAGMTIVGVY